VTKDEALDLALEAMLRYQVKRQDFDRFADEIAAIKQALAAPVQECESCKRKDCLLEMSLATIQSLQDCTSPAAQRPVTEPHKWVGLTDEEREGILDREFRQWWSRHDAVCRAIEAKLKEKNT